MKIYPLLFVFLCLSANAAVFEDGEHYLSAFVDEENIINAGATINPVSDGTITVGDVSAVTIENHGIINGNLNTGDHIVHIQNSGEFVGQIIVNADNLLTQIIETDADITSLPIVGGDYTVNVNGFRDFADITKLKNLSAGNFIITDSNIIMDDFSEWQNWDDLGVSVGLSGANTLYVRNSSTVNSGDSIEFTNHASTMNVVLLDLDKLHKTQVVVEPYGILSRLYIVRETNYEKVFDDNRGVLLERVRAKNPNDKFLMRLDATENMTDLQNVMNSSYHFNKSVLMRPGAVFDNFSLMGVLDDSENGNIGFAPVYIMSDNINSSGLRLNFSGEYEGWRIGAELKFNKFDYQNEFNDFSGLVYGADIKAKKAIKDFWIDGVVGVSVIDFDADNIYVDGKIKNNPLGLSLYGVTDFGYDYKLFDNLFVAPFVGGMFSHHGVAGFSDFDVNLRGGGKLKYSFDIDGIKYEYLFVGGIKTNQDLFGMFKLGFISNADGGGVYIGTDLFRDEYGLNYKFSVDAKLIF